MKNTAFTSEAGLQRLPRYYRCLQNLIGEDILRISSVELAAYMGVSAAVVRQDFRLLGGLGQQGYGYNVKDLYTRIGEILGMSRNFPIILVCGTDYGLSFARHPMFSMRGVSLRAIFDTRFSAPDNAGASALPQKPDTSGPVPILPLSSLSSYCSQHHPAIAILMVPRNLAQKTARLLEENGVRAIWNLTGIRLTLPKTVVRDINPLDSLLELTCILNTNGSGT